MLRDPPGERVSPVGVTTVGERREVVEHDDVTGAVVLWAVRAGEEHVGTKRLKVDTGEPDEVVRGRQVRVPGDLELPPATGRPDLRDDHHIELGEQPAHRLDVAPVARVTSRTATGPPITAHRASGGRQPANVSDACAGSVRDQPGGRVNSVPPGGAVKIATPTVTSPRQK